MVINKSKKTDSPKMEYEPNVISLNYYCGGNEYGESKSIYLSDYEFEYSIDGKYEKYNFLINEYNTLDEIIDKYKLKELINLEKNDTEVKEAFSLTINFKDGTIINLSDNYKMSTDTKLAIKEILALFENLID